MQEPRPAVHRRRHLFRRGRRSSMVQFWMHHRGDRLQRQRCGGWLGHGVDVQHRAGKVLPRVVSVLRRVRVLEHAPSATPAASAVASSASSALHCDGARPERSARRAHDHLEPSVPLLSLWRAVWRGRLRVLGAGDARGVAVHQLLRWWHWKQGDGGEDARRGAHAGPRGRHDIRFVLHVSLCRRGLQRVCAAHGRHNPAV